MLTDIEIAQKTQMKKIKDVALTIGIEEDDLELYGNYMAKIKSEAYSRLTKNKGGKLILVTAVNPTPAGEGKTTTTVGLGQAMAKLGKKAVLALREPSLGPVFGVKGGAAGGGYAQVMPMEKINLHFTGDLHAITAANNLLCAVIDNHIHQGNELNIDPRTVTFKRVMDMNDRALRNIVVGLGTKNDGIPRQDGFMISVASEIMAILCLSADIEDLKNKLSNILVGYTYSGDPVFCKQLSVVGSLAALLKDALDPNLVQTLENTACFMHGGPFANIAHGCNSIKATRLAIALSDYCITEAGFGSDLGAEKFFDITCRYGDYYPDAVVLVATIRALKYNGGIPKDKLSEENTDALKKGCENLKAHIDNINNFGVPVVVTLNRFGTDTEAELEIVRNLCEEMNVDFALSEVFAKGGEGGIELAKAAMAACEKSTGERKFIYDLEMSIADKLNAVAVKVYGADGIVIEPKALKEIEKIEKMGFGNLPVCIAKTQYSLSDDAKLLGRPRGFKIHVRDIKLSAGAGFVVALTGAIVTMPGLSKVPAAVKIDVDGNGNISGLF